MFTASSEARLPHGQQPAPSPLASRFATTSFGFAGGASRAHPGFASLSLAVPGQKDPKNASCCAKVVKEAATGMEFSKEFCTRGQTNCSKVTGLGVRAKKILGLKNINVYAVGLYVDASAMKSKLAKYKGQDESSLSKDKNMYHDLIKAQGVEKTVRLIINYGGITQSQFWGALEERLQPPLEKAGESKTLEKFGALFDNVKFRKGLDIAFTCTGNTMVTRVDGKEVGRIHSGRLNEALLGVYLGDSPVSQDAKVNFGRGIASILSS